MNFGNMNSDKTLVKLKGSLEWFVYVLLRNNVFPEVDLRLIKTDIPLHTMLVNNDNYNTLH